MNNKNRVIQRTALASIVLLVAGATWASNFRAADQVYLGAVARVASGNVVFLTDVVISNVSDSTVKVEVALSEGIGGTANATSAANIKTVGVLAPGERREIVDFAATVLGRPTGTTFGQAIFFACKDGGNCSDCNTNAADCKNITVEARIYSVATSGCPNGATTCTNGQLFSGIPFYNFVSRDSASRGLDKIAIVGLRQTGTRTAPASGFRSNLGFTNATNTGSTVLLVKAFTNAGVQIGADARVSLGPLGHFQTAVTTLFPTFSGAGFVTVEQESVTPAGPEESIPGFLAYGSVLDNSTDDPTTLESQYLEPLDFACVYGSGKTAKRLVKRQ